MTDEIQHEGIAKERVDKLNQLKEMGINPYPYRFEVTKKAKQIKEDNKGLEHGQENSDEVSVAGRIVLLRSMGKATFLTIQDDTDRVQIYIRQDSVGEDSYKVLKLTDIGDYIGAKGSIFATKTGEITVNAKEFTLLSKAVRHLPEKFHGLQDTETKYRKRHLDLIMNQESKEVFRKKLQIMQAIREFMAAKGFLEVETPILQSLYGGAAAKPFTTHHNALNMPLYMRISPELYLKKLLVGGFEKIFEINKNFRNEGIDTTHNPEFTMMECYQAYADYEDMMKLQEDLFESVANKVLGTTKIIYKGKEVDVSAPWPRVKMVDEIKRIANIDVTSMNAKQLYEEVKKAGIDTHHEAKWGNMVLELFEHFCEETYVKPTFVIDHPIETTPLCKPTKYDEKMIERFEAFSMGMELSNAYSELNNPVLQRELLEDQQRQLTAGDEEANPLDETFLEAIEQGMPPAGGMGIGIDRMMMLLLGQESIRDIIFFPTMKPKK